MIYNLGDKIRMVKEGRSTSGLVIPAGAIGEIVSIEILEIFDPDNPRKGRYIIDIWFPAERVNGRCILENGEPCEYFDVIQEID